MDRYAYVNNNPVRYTDPTGHTPCFGKNYDDGPNCLKNSDSQLSFEIRNTKYQNECAKGMHQCDELLAFGVTAIVTGGLIEYGVLGGGLADAAAAAPAAGLRGLAQCLVSAMCRSALQKVGLESWAIRQLSKAGWQNPSSSEFVAGLYPAPTGENYVQMAERLGNASHFNMSDDIWNIVKSNQALTWDINRGALQMVKDKGMTVVLQVDISAITNKHVASSIYNELMWFVSNNYINKGTNVLVPTTSLGAP